jgi:hypothetical protein
MAVKASLQFILKANNVVVAETSNAAVWQQALALITGSSKLPAVVSGLLGKGKLNGTAKTPAAPSSPTAKVGSPTDSLARLAVELGLDPAQIRAACNPSTVPPYFQLDLRAWEDFKRHLPPPGFNAVPQIVLATTLLALWFRRIDLGPVTIKQGQEALRTIGLRDKNPVRGLNHCPWLQLTGETVRLRPTKLPQALAVARAYCSHKPIEEIKVEKMVGAHRIKKRS